jgi:hypothetical protein
MKFAKSFLMGTGAVVMAALALTLVVPKAAHAVAVAAVEVVNTVARPVVSQDVSKSASQIVELFGGAWVGVVNPLTASSPTGENLGPYTVPAGQMLVITDIECMPTSITTSYSTLGIVQSGISRDAWQVSNAKPTTQLVFPSGIVIASGQQLQTTVFSGQGNPVQQSVVVRGYLTTN